MNDWNSAKINSSVDYEIKIEETPTEGIMVSITKEIVGN